MMSRPSLWRFLAIAGLISAIWWTASRDDSPTFSAIEETGNHPKIRRGERSRPEDFLAKGARIFKPTGGREKWRILLDDETVIEAAGVKMTERSLIIEGPFEATTKEGRVFLSSQEKGEHRIEEDGALLTISSVK